MECKNNEGRNFLPSQSYKLINNLDKTIKKDIIPILTTIGLIEEDNL
jgi:hypothetical protein